MNSYDAGVVGLGAIGLPVSNNLSQKFKIQGWNRSELDTSKVHNQNLHIVKDIKEFNTSLFFVLLSDENSIFEVLDNGLLEKIKTGDLLVIMSTISPKAMFEIQARIELKGARVIDAPVSGGDVGAQKAELAIMLAGDPEDCTRANTFLASTAKSIRYVGTLGQAQILKACNQVIVGANLVALAEALTMARDGGISDHDFFEVISNGLGGSTVLNTKWEKLISGKFEMGGKSKYQLKDMRIALEIAKTLALPLPLSEVVAEIYQIQINRGLGNLDHSSVILQYMESDEI